MYKIVGVLMLITMLFSAACTSAGPSPTPASTAAPKSAQTPTPAPPSPVSTPKPTAEEPRYGGVLFRANFDDPVSFDVHQETLPNSHLVLANFYSGLARLDSADVTKVVPDLAEKWESNADGSVWTFSLRKGVKWHDGKAFTSEDAKFSLERMAFWKEHKIVSPRGGALLTAVQGVEAPDENTVRVKLKYPSASFIANIATGWVLIMPKHTIEAKGDMKKDINGTGPFKFKSYNPMASFEMVKNADYFIKGRPYLDGITFFPIKDDATRLSAFRVGRTRMTTTGARGLSHPEAELIRKEMPDKAVVVTHTSYLRAMILLKTNKAPWNDVRVRKAIDLALDRQAAIKINSGIGMLGATMDPSGQWGIPEAEMKDRPGYRQPKDADIAEAKRLLAEAGYAASKTTMLVRSGGTYEKIGILVKEHLAKIGMDVTLDLKDAGAITDLYNRKAFDISATVITDPLDDPDVATAYYVTNGARNFGDFSDKQVDELLDKQARTIDVNERKKMVRQLQERMLELAPYPILYWDLYNMGYWKEVRGYKPGGGAFSHSALIDVWLAK